MITSKAYNNEEDRNEDHAVGRPVVYETPGLFVRLPVPPIPSHMSKCT